jgi:hypothetical protein
MPSATKWMLSALVASAFAITSKVSAAPPEQPRHLRLPSDAFLCGPTVTVFTGVGGYPVVTKAALHGRLLTVWVTYGGKNAHPLAADWGLGFQLDDGPTTGVHPLVGEAPGQVALSFAALARGRHQLRVGLLSPTHDLQLDNRYCFTVPGYVTWLPVKP